MTRGGVALLTAIIVLVAGCSAPPGATTGAPPASEVTFTGPVPTPLDGASAGPIGPAGSVPATVAVTPAPATTPVASTTPAASTAPAPSTTPSNSGPGSGGRTFTTVASGDLLWHNTTYTGVRTGQPVGSPGEFDLSKMFAAMKPIIAGADLAICHEEVPFAPVGGPYLNYPIFAAPPQVATAIAAAGWDACTTASNHSLDQGVVGLVRTYDTLKKAGVQPVGTFPNAQARNVPVVMNAGGVRVGLVGGTYGLNGLTLPANQAWAVSLWNAQNLLAQARAARQAGAEVVIVQMHGGNEYQTAPSSEQVALATQLTASADVDLVIGQHVHVVQPITTINGKWVVYGMGNMIAQQPPDDPRTWEGITTRFTFTEQPGGRFVVSRAEYLPTLITPASQGPVQVLPVVTSLRSKQGPTTRLQQARSRCASAVNSLGKTPGLVES